ncbi:phage portal protein [Alkalibacillus salilacus]|uniref:SPP1 family phage portal protein n=1 Tax=Alkalibacillus salilacus TaxID=284582 RepID=A0ABT9VCW9_9BACI|nr:phage portal protein [Alkalibacillus salilacus]MDQ0158815.1 SPP1 family phage portal protein [Alkalibacillus salilacus]
MQKANEFEHGLDGNSGIKRRFSKYANIQYTHDSAEELVKNTDDLSEMIKHHVEHQRPRLDVLDDYYKGDNTAISVLQRRKEDDKADHRARHNYAKYVSNFMQGFLVGVPIAMSHKDESTQAKIKQINETIEDAALNADLILDLSIYGRAYELLHRNHDDEVKVYLSSPLETFLIYDNTIEKNIVAAVRYFVVGYGDNQKIKVELYTEKRIYTYYTSNLGDYSLKHDDDVEHPFGAVPINEHSNNRFRQGDFENVLDLIDLYDAAQSDTANYMTDLNDAMLKISGNLELTPEEAKKMKEANILFLKPASDNAEGKEGNVDADYIYKQYDVSGSEAYKSRLQIDIHKMTNTPDLTDSKINEQSGVPQSGEAMKYKLFGLEQIRINKERLFKRSLNRRYKLINNVMALASEASDGEFEGLTYKFTPNLPKSTKDSVDMFNAVGGELSQETKLKIIPMIVEDPEEEQKKIDEERSQRRQSQSSRFMAN